MLYFALRTICIDDILTENSYECVVMKYFFLLNFITALYKAKILILWKNTWIRELVLIVRYTPISCYGYLISVFCGIIKKKKNIEYVQEAFNCSYFVRKSKLAVPKKISSSQLRVWQISVFIKRAEVMNCTLHVQYLGLPRKICNGH